MPSGSFCANAAWLTLAAIAHNLTRAAGALASLFHAKARTGTIRRHLITLPARIARRSCRITLRLPLNWPHRNAFADLFTAPHAPKRSLTRMNTAAPGPIGDTTAESWTDQQYLHAPTRLHDPQRRPQPAKRSLKVGRWIQAKHFPVIPLFAHVAKFSSPSSTAVGTRSAQTSRSDVSHCPPVWAETKGLHHGRRVASRY